MAESKQKMKEAEERLKKLEDAILRSRVESIVMVCFIAFKKGITDLNTLAELIHNTPTEDFPKLATELLK